MSIKMTRLIFLGFFFISTAVVRAQEQTVAGALITEPATLISIGFEWYITGDNDRDAEVKVHYRKKGQTSWKEALPLLRIGNEKAGEPVWSYVTPNMFAGSIFDLDPGTEYECRLELTDPDGVEGTSEALVTVTTRQVPSPASEGEVRHVYPQNYEGKREAPAYNGLLHAYYGYPRFADWILTADPVKPGDVIVVHSGLYKADFTSYRDFHGLTFDGTYYFTQDGTEEKPITIKAAGDGEVIFDGNGAAVLFDLTAGDHHYFEGLTLRNADEAIRAGLMNAYGCEGLTVVDCQIVDIGIGIRGQFEGSKFFYIADNTFTGREDTASVNHHTLENGKSTQRIKSYYAIKLHGQGHTVCYNRVQYFFDGIDICTHAGPETDQGLKSVAMDFYNNDIFICNDNFIEADGGMHNIRIMRNRCFNSGQQALSNQPVLGGPVYWIRNVVYNCGNASTFKSWGMYPSGVIAYHNTATGIAARSDKPYSNVHFRNNLFLPPDDADLATLGMYSFTDYSTFDYNGYRYREPFIRWYAPEQSVDYSNEHEAREFETLEAFSVATGQEKHGIVVDYDVFINASPPAFQFFTERHKDRGVFYPVYYPEDVNLRLKSNSIPINAGCVLKNVNDDYSGEAPDLGAYEYGKPLPIYGPRKEKLQGKEVQLGQQE